MKKIILAVVGIAIITIVVLLSVGTVQGYSQKRPSVTPFSIIIMPGAADVCLVNAGILDMRHILVLDCR